jgi:hypothetical protein
MNEPFIKLDPLGLALSQCPHKVHAVVDGRQLVLLLTAGSAN